VQAYRSSPHGAGRPWDAQTAWASLLLLEDADIGWLPYHRLRRLKQKLRTVSAEELVWCARKRATAARYSVSPSFSEDLKRSLCLTGMGAAAAADLGLTASTSAIDGYAAEADRIVADFYLMPDRTGNCTVRTAFDAPGGLLDAEEMPVAVVAADLASSLDARERRCGLDYLEGALNAIR